MSNKKDIFKYLGPRIDNIASIENLFFAWKKLENEFSFYDVWYEEESFKRFKFNLKSELSSLREEMLSGIYKLQPIHLMPFPKSGVEKVRQSFRIAVRDQVAWVAVCNILGPFAEKKMPAWSFGNRLFVPMWREHQIPENEYDEIKHKWRNGKFLNSNGRVYQPWNRSWPRFRHLLTATMKKMAFIELDKEEKDFVEGSSQLDPWLKLQYIQQGYFKDNSEETSVENINKSIQNDQTHTKERHIRDIYWASIDLTQFYPNIKCPILYDNLIKYCNVREKKAKELIKNMLSFEIVPPEYDEIDLERLGLEDEKWKDFQGLPTGILVGGWLANIYLLESDLEVDAKLKENKNVAHFRYVDDHTFLSYSPKELLHWVQSYRKLLQDKLGLVINAEKFQPGGEYEIVINNLGEGSSSDSRNTLGKVFLEENWDEEYFNTESHAQDTSDEWERYDGIISEIEKQCIIDPMFPTPLMTQTLEKVSQLGSLDLDLLNDREIASVIHDLKTLIVTDFPNEEIREDTRISFASTMLSRMLRGRNFDYGLLSTLRKQWLNRRQSYFDELKEKGESEDTIKELSKKISEKSIFDLPIAIDKEKLVLPDSDDPELKHINSQISRILYSSSYSYLNTCNSVFLLLKKAAGKVPDKVKIWIRLTEFCLDHIPKKLNEVFSLLKSTKGKTLNELGFRFIQSQLYSLISTILIRRSWDYHFSKKEELGNQDLRKCIDSIISITLLKPEFSFEVSSEKLFKIALKFAKSIIELKDTGLIEFSLEGNDDDNLFSVSWILDAAPKNKMRDYNLFTLFSSVFNTTKQSSTMLEYILRIVVTSSIDYSENEKSLIRRMMTFSNSDELRFLETLKEKTKHSECRDGYILLKDFIDGYFFNIKNEEWKESLTHARMSELFMLKLCQCISDAIDKTDTIEYKDYTEFIDCNHIAVKIEDIHKVWSVSRLQEEINVYFITDKNIEDSFILLNDNFEMKRLYKIGVVLYNLLARTSDLYWLKVRPEYGYEWTFHIRQLAETGKIGSYSERLLCGCLLPTTRELSELNVTLDNVKVVSYYFSPTFIPHIAYLSKMIKQYLESMTYAVVPINDKIFRELKIIDLE